jgi:mycothiol synthase
MSTDPVRFAMRLDDLSNLPSIAIAPGYHIRTYREGDAAAWSRIMNGQVGAWDEERFFAKVHDQPVFRADGLFFAVRNETPAATACAWWVPEKYGPDVGVLHMVATDPEHRHMGLGRAVSVSVMHFFAHLGMQACLLSTTTERLPAIRLYLSLGFEPVLDSSEIKAAWSQIERDLV